MIVLGLVLLVLAALLGVAVVVSNPAVLVLSVFGAQVPATMAGVFFTGAATMVVVVLALVLIQRGVARSRRERRVRRNLPAPVPTAAASSPRTPRVTASDEADTDRRAPSPEPATDRGSARGAHAVETAGTAPSTPAERAALLAESDQLTHDEPSR